MTKSDFCTHCGRTVNICFRLGSPDCQEARQTFFKEQQERIEFLTKQWKAQRDAAGDASK